MKDSLSIKEIGNTWGKQGWTLNEMSKVNENLLMEALTTAYCQIAPKKLADQIRFNANK